MSKIGIMHLLARALDQTAEYRAAACGQRLDYPCHFVNAVGVFQGDGDIKRCSECKRLLLEAREVPNA